MNKVISDVHEILKDSNEGSLQYFDNANVLIRTVSFDGCEIYWPIYVDNASRAEVIKQKIQKIVNALTQND